MHETISPAILYWGTPIALITTLNGDGTTNIAPMSSACWLAHRCVIGLARTSQTPQNLIRTKQCVLNLPSDDMTAAVNALARTTGSEPVPEWKRGAGYEFVSDKFAHAGLTAQESQLVRPERIKECPVQMEAELVVVHGMMEDLPDRAGALQLFELKVLRVHVESSLRLEGHLNRVDSGKLRLMFMAFGDYYAMREGKLVESRLAEIDERQYRVLTRSEVVGQGSDGDVVRDEESEVIGL